MNNIPGKTNAWQWNPPRRCAPSEHLQAAKDVQSMTECTGLMQHIPENESEAQALSSLYAIHPVKPQGNIGKDNPQNDPDEIHFHRA